MQTKDKVATSLTSALSSSPDVALRHTEVPLIKLLEAMVGGAHHKRLQPALAQIIFQMSISFQDSFISSMQSKEFDIADGNIMVQLHNYAASSIVHSRAFKAFFCYCSMGILSYILTFSLT